MNKAVFTILPKANDEDEENQVRLIISSLPEEFQSINESDRWVVCITLFRSLASVLSPAHTHEYEKNLNSHLKRVVAHCRELRTHVREVENLTHLGPDVFERAWRRRVFGKDVVLARDGSELEVVRMAASADGEPVLLSTTLESLEVVAAEILDTRSERIPSSRPPKKTLGQVCFYVARAWTALSTLHGQSISAAFPSGRNKGYRWSLHIIGFLMKTEQMSALNLGSRAEGTIRRHLGAAVKDLKQALQSRPYCEPEADWQKVGRDSLVGLELLARTAGVGARSEMNGPSKILDQYFSKHRRWVRRHDKTVTDFNPF